MTDEPPNGPAPYRPNLKPARRHKSGNWFRRFMRSDGMERLIAGIIRGLIRLVRRIGRERATAMVRSLVRVVGPLLPENKTAADNIAMAFPEKSEAERAAILKGCWENFAAVAVEFLFLKEMTEVFDPAKPDEGPITVSGIDRFVKLRDDGRTAVIVAAHLANWEVLGAISKAFGLDTVLPYRAPTNAGFAEDMLAERQALMGLLVPNSRGAAFEIATAMEAGAHLGILVDQKLFGGLPVPFFGHAAPTNPLAARFARQFDCPVHGARAIRRPDGGLHLELTDAIDMPRDGEGLIDIAAGTAKITAVVEGWVREHPEQWLWLHDRWGTAKAGKRR